MNRFLLFALSAGLAFHAHGQQVASAPPEPQTARAVPVQYYLSLPEGWNAATTWPILVTIDGSGHNHLGNFQSFVRARKKSPFIIVTPCVNSNGKDPADAPAILTIVQEVQKEHHGRPKFFLTGFSAGGHPAWQIAFTRPELLAGVAPAAANFSARGISTISNAPERVQLPIRSFQGDQDEFLKFLDPQWELARKQALDAGYQNLSRTVIPKAGHAAFAQEVIDYFSTLLP